MNLHKLFDMPLCFQRSIGRELAIDMAQSGWWKDKPTRIVAEFQLHTAELCMDFGSFHGVMEEALGRPVWTHEFARPDLLRAELRGKSPAPSFDEIMSAIPAEKRLFIEIGRAP